MSTNNRDLAGVMRRLRKILALTESSNPGEAAAALQQARTIMDRYGIDAVDAAASAVGQATTKMSGAEMPVWEAALVDVIRRTLGVEAVREYFRKVPGLKRPRGAVIFIGEGPKAKIAAYAFDVLRKKLRQAMQASTEDLVAKAFPEGPPEGAKLKLTAKQRHAYAMGWCAGVQSKVQQLVHTPSPAVSRYMETFGELKSAPPPAPSKRPRKLDAVSIHLTRQGLRDGDRVELHQAVHGSQGQQALLN